MTTTEQAPDTATQRLIVLQLLDGEQTFDTLCETLDDVDPDAIRSALANLADEGVAVMSGGPGQPPSYRASPCARRLEQLDLIAV